VLQRVRKCNISKYSKSVSRTRTKLYM